MHTTTTSTLPFTLPILLLLPFFPFHSPSLDHTCTRHVPRAPHPPTNPTYHSPPARQNPLARQNLPARQSLLAGQNPCPQSRLRYPAQKTAQIGATSAGCRTTCCPWGRSAEQWAERTRENGGYRFPTSQTWNTAHRTKGTTAKLEAAVESY